MHLVAACPVTPSPVDCKTSSCGEELEIERVSKGGLHNSGFGVSSGSGSQRSPASHRLRDRALPDKEITACSEVYYDADGADDVVKAIEASRYKARKWFT